MQNPLENNYTLGFDAGFEYGLPLQQRLELFKEAGFEAVSVWWGDREELYREGRQSEITDIVLGSGLALDHAHIPYDFTDELWIEDTTRRKAAVNFLISRIEECGKYGVPVGVIHVSPGASDLQPNRLGIESISKILNAAEDAGVIIAVENTMRPEFMDFVFAELESPMLRFCYDASHECLYGGGENGSILRKYGHLLAVTHLADTDGIKDPHALPGEGVIDWKKVAASLSEVKPVCLMLETVRTPGWKEGPLEKYLAAAFSSVKRIKEMIVY